MFTPQRKPSPAITLTPRTAAPNASSVKPDNLWKGKAVAILDGPPPPRGSDGGSFENMEDWRNFKEAGLLDEATLERKDNEALLEKVLKLEKELFDYQHNMGLLLMEKREWSLKCEELGHAVEEAREILKREQSAHLIAVSEMEKREQNLRNALGSERHCIADLEKEIRDVQKDRVRVERDSERKRAEAEALVEGIKERALEVERKLHDANTKLDEVNRKSSELDEKLQGLDTRETAVQRERLALSTEREAHKMEFYKRREELNEWERKMQREEERAGELQRALNERQEKVNQVDESFEQKEQELEELEKKIDLSLKTLKKREDNTNSRMSELLAKEKQADSDEKILGLKEKELLMLEHKLHAREKLEIQSIVDEQKAVLDSKMHEFDLELKESRKNLKDELRNKAETVKQHEVENLHREEMFRKREQALNVKSERVKEKEKDFDTRLKSIKEKEKFMKAEQKKIDLEKKELLADKEGLLLLKDECEKMRIEIDEQKMQIVEEREKLKTANNEKIEYLRLQAELKQELDRCRRQQDFLLNEAEDLKHERQKFEKEWEVLEEKRAQIAEELKKIANERDNLQKLQNAEEERLKKLELETQQNIQRELEALILGKESFETRMKHEQSTLHESTGVEHDQMVQNFESQKHQMETELMTKQEELVKGLQKREKMLEEQKEREFKEINNSKDVLQRELQEIELQRRATEKEKQELASDRENLKRQQLEIKKDIDELCILGKSLRVQREQSVNERNRFIAFVEMCKNCNTCGEITRDFVLSNLQPSEVEDALTIPLPKLSDNLVRSNEGADASYVVNIDRSPGELEKELSNSQRHMSWLQKCTSKIFSLSPIKMVEHDSKPVSPASASHVNIEAQAGESILLGANEVENIAHPRYGSRPSSRTAEDSIDSRQVQSDENREVDIEYSVSIDHSHMESMLQDDASDAEQSKLKSNRRKSERKRKTGISRTRSVKAVVEDAKAFLGESPEIGESQDVLDHPEEAATNTSKKRQSVPAESEQATADSEGPSDSGPAGGQRKRRRVVPSASHAPGQQRYNLRRQKNVGTVPVNQMSSDLPKPEEKDGNQPRLDHEITVQSLGEPSENGKSTHTMHVTTVKAVEIHEERVVRFETTEVDGQADERRPAKAAEVDRQANETRQTEEATEMSVEVSGTQDYEDEYGSTIREEDDDDEEDDDEEDSEHPGEVSIGRKIWTFFTS